MKDKVIKRYDEISKYNFLCKNCGMCSSKCPMGAIKMEKNQYSQYIPTLDFDRCIGCGKCLNVCRALDFNTTKHKSLLGNYQYLLLAHSTDEKFRSSGSSGGVISSLINFGLKTSFFKNVLTLTCDDNCIQPKPVIVDKVSDYNKCSGSKYISYPICEAYNNKLEKLAVTALPCCANHLCNESNRPFIFGLFCSKAFTYNLFEYVCKKEGIDITQVRRLDFRAGKWPGNVEITLNNNKKITIPYNRSYFTAISNSYFFTQAGCLFCDDYFCVEADISFGDPWFKDYKRGSDGDTVVIIRTERGKKLIDEALAAKIIDAESIDEARIIKGHAKEIYMKKTAILSRIKWAEKLVGKKFKYNENSFISHGRNGSFFNSFFLFNNIIIKQKGWDKYVFKVPHFIMFMYRFVHAFIMQQYIKFSKYILGISR